MGTLLRVGEQEVSTYRNMVVNPVPFQASQITASYYSGNPNPGATVSYLLDQVDGPTTSAYGQYLEDYARITVPVTGTGTDEDPYTVYQLPVLTRRRVDITAADFVDRPRLNVLHYYRAPAAAKVRLTCFWYSATNIQVYAATASTYTVDSDGWHWLAANFSAPAQSILDQVAYVYIGMELSSGLTPSKNYYDVTGFRATPTANSGFADFQGNYWDGSTDFPSGTYIGSWNGTPRASMSTLTITEIAALTAQTESQMSMSVEEDVTGMDAASISGGTGQASLTIPNTDEVADYQGLASVMEDFTLGNFYGRVRNLSDATEDGTTEVTSDESLALLNAWVTAPPMSGTVQSVLRNYVSLAEAPIRAFDFEDGVGDIAADVPGFVGNLYDKIREFLAAYAAELVTIDGVHVVRSMLRDSVALENFASSPNVTSSLQETSQYVRVHWYDNEYLTNQEVYPLPQNPGEPDADAPEPTVYSVGANQTLTVDIQLRASLVSVSDPTYIAFVPDEPVSGNSIYTAVGSDSLPITPAQWAAGGGSCTVEISEEDPSIIRVTMRGPNFPSLSPFRLAMSSGNGNYYNALHITGTGIFVRDQALDLATGALPSATGQEYAVECTNPFISTKSQAYRAGHIIAGRIAQAQTITATIPTPERESALDEPVLGMLPGKKFVHRNQQWRIEGTDVGPDTVTVNGVFALTVDDFDYFFTRTEGLTVDEFDALYAGRTVTALNFSLRPLLHRFVEV